MPVALRDGRPHHSLPPTFVKSLTSYTCKLTEEQAVALQAYLREHNFKGLVTSFGATALAMTREYKPDVITLDIFLPDIGGWRVLERLKDYENKLEDLEIELTPDVPPRNSQPIEGMLPLFGSAFMHLTGPMMRLRDRTEQ